MNTFLSHYHSLKFIKITIVSGTKEIETEPT